MEEKPVLEKIIYSFYQEGNSDGTTEETEELTVEVMGPLGSIIEEGGYLVIRTTTGWSINNPSELMDLLEHIKTGVSSEKKS